MTTINIQDGVCLKLNGAFVSQEGYGSMGSMAGARLSLAPAILPILPYPSCETNALPYPILEKR